MELNNLSEIWSKYDKHLSENLKVNTELLRYIRLDKSSKELAKPVQFEVFSVCVFFIVGVFVFFRSLGLANELKFSIAGFVATAILVVYIVLASIKIVSISRIELFSTPILQLQKQLSQMKIIVLKLRKIELILGIPLAISIIPILFKVVHNIDVYRNWGWLVAELSIIIALGYSAMLLFNKFWYDRKIRNAQEFLSKIESFEKELLPEEVY